MRLPKILIDRNIDRDIRMKYRQYICWVLEASNVMMKVSNGVMEASDDVLADSDVKNANVR